MELLSIANFLVSSLSAMSSMVQAYNSSKVTNKDISKAQKRLDEPLKNGGAKIAQVIDSNLLNTLSSKAEKEARELISLIKETQDTEQLQKPMREASTRLCFYLSQIKSHNNGDLPTKRLNELWISHRCDNGDACDV
ncbi:MULTISPECIES: hypothetical protein [Vibrio]|uniref:hypothetical protein n=1 Tax=Vibrio TaxID=662 RepID=UPI0004A24FE6|nr:MULTISPECIES: hypothetical protein [Vibrio]EGQ7664801.1 hypothetical protein [Vibrio parahaemolyticus]EGR3257553.1 hypothetical protein [Vibrio parahaemolyticus]KOY22040.1 hypothetical protein ACX12_16300 [Vibrio parahaemolyticus]KYY08018.1 hypothetical protein AWQ10_16620 [Vibrio parahaemolyticus]MBO0211400.1 hypothetical protein [Vibrio sp. Vb0877]